MIAKNLLEELEFHDPLPYAQPILVDRHSRILRWMLKPGQQIERHSVPDSPFYVVVVKGRGIFTGAEEQEMEFGPNSLLLFAQGEAHTVRALDEELVFVSFMEASESMRPERTGGEVGRTEHE